MKKLFLLLPLLVLSFNALQAEDKTTQMPSIVIRDMEGKEIDLKKYASDDKYTIFSFWATWCSPCKKELENINDVLSEWKDKYNVQLVGISIDDSRNAMKVKPYVNGKKWKFDILIDVNQETKRLLNYPNVPYTLLMDKEGNIIYKHIGYQEGDEFVLEEELKKITK